MAALSPTAKSLALIASWDLILQGTEYLYAYNSKNSNKQVPKENNNI